MTKRKWKAPEPEEFARLSDWCFRYGLPDGGRTVIRGDGRAFARKMLANVLPAWEFCWTYGQDDGTQVVMRGDFPGKREVVARFNLPELQRELSAENFALVKALYEALKEQARVANYAVGVAEVELGTAMKRSEGGKKAAQARVATAKKRIEKLQAEEAKLRKMEPSLKKEAVAAILADRGLGRKGTIEKQLRRPSKKSSEGK